MESIRLCNGSIFDGTGAAPFAGDLLIVDGRIKAVGEVGENPAREVIDVGGLAVAPGFIDVHTHSDFAPFLPEGNDDLRTASIRQGVTTEICGNCGFSTFPTKLEWREPVTQHLSSLFGASSAAYASFAEYAEAVSERPLFSNLASLVGHGTIRAGTLGLSNRHASHAEIDEMERRLSEAFEQGAVGLSSGLIYPPGIYASGEELAHLAEVVAGYARPYVTHMRDEADHVMEALEEALSVAQTSGAALHISHHKIAGRVNWGRSAATLRRLEQARNGGVDVTIDAYPYLAGSTMLRALLPPWINEDGVEGLLERLADPRSRRRLARDMEIGLPGWQDLVRAAGWDSIAISSAPRHPEFEGRSLSELARDVGATPVEFCCDLLLSEKAAVTIVAHMMGEDDVRQILAFPPTLIGSDGIPLPGKPHPRWAGTFARVLGKYSRDQMIFELSEVIRKMTSAAADRFNLRDRGRIAPGFAADVVVFDPMRVDDRATYDEPLEHPRGVSLVLVNGAVAVREGEPTGRSAGRVLRAS
jgi:N-acyl-D-amino-acid deacylase